jgi:hypothetical protein
MKKTITFLAILFITSVFATDRFVDPNLSQGNGTILFTSITDAVAAAVNGDRIIIAPSTYNEEALTINKSLQILPQTVGSIINFNANIFVSGFAGMNLEIIGFNLGTTYNIITTSNGSINNRAKINLIDSSAKKVLIDHDGYKINLLNCDVSELIKLKYGSVVKCTTNNLFLVDEAYTSLASGYTLIAANDVQSDLYLRTDNTEYKVVNNNLNNLRVTKWSLLSSVTNEISNNNFQNGCKLHFAIFAEDSAFNTSASGLDMCGQYKVSNYNFNFNNNLFQGNVLYSDFNTNLNAYSQPEKWWPWVYGASLYNGTTNELILDEQNDNNGRYFYSSTSTVWPNTTSEGFFEFSYNGLVNPNFGNATTLVFTNIAGPNSSTNGGNPNHRYYDIDLTINDRGVNGGPFSQLNYNASNPNNSRAYIFDLDMPTDLFPGQNVEIKAKGYHSN